jgi:hypothetical protein
VSEEISPSHLGSTYDCHKNFNQTSQLIEEHLVQGMSEKTFSLELKPIRDHASSQIRSRNSSFSGSMLENSSYDKILHKISKNAFNKRYGKSRESLEAINDNVEYELIPPSLTTEPS